MSNFANIFSDTVVINCEFRFDKESISFCNRLAKMFVQIVSYFVFHDFFLLSFIYCTCVCVCFMGYISAPTYHL